MRAFAFVLIATASACVFQAVEECPRQGCPPDDSGLPGSGDAGAPDGGDGGLPVLDAGHGSDAGTDGGTPDAGLTFDGCLDELQGLVPRFPYADFIHVKGLAGPFGAIDYISGGGGAGGRGPNGSLWSLVPDEFNQQVPPAFHATTFWMVGVSGWLRSRL